MEVFSLEIAIATFVVVENKLRDKRSSLFGLSVGDAEKKAFSDIVTCGQCYETFYGCKLRRFILSLSVCHWKTFPV
jgi:hypothetical protein